MVEAAAVICAIVTGAAAAGFTAEAREAVRSERPAMVFAATLCAGVTVALVAWLLM